MLKPKLFSIIKHKDVELPKKQLINDIIAGIIVGIIALPLSIALAIASGVSPESGIITAFIAGFFISFLGGSRVQIGGPTGAFVVIVYGIVSKYGVSGLTIATIMAGILMIFFGIMKFGSVIKFIPYPTTTGFTAGIAVVLLSTQVKDFLGLKIDNVPADFIGKWHSYFLNFSTIQYITAGIGILSLCIIILWPKINKTVPGSLVAIIVATLLVKFLHLPVETIGSRFGEISNSIRLVDFSSMEISFETVKELFRPALTIAFLASIESLLSAVVADGMIGKKHNSNMELIAQGVANIASALFGGIPATGAIARTAANVKNGGRTPIAGIVHSIFLLLTMLIFMPLAGLIPMTTLAAILIVVSYNMSEWRACKALLKSTKSDISVLIITFSFTVLFDLVVAIEFSMVVAMFLFVRRMSENTKIADISHRYDIYHIDSSDEDDSDEDTINNEELLSDSIRKNLNPKIFLYEINGPLFFGAANTFIDVMAEIDCRSSIIIFRMKHVTSMDATALNALKQLNKRCKAKHILILYSEMNEQPLNLLRKNGSLDNIGKDRFFESTEAAVEAANEILSIEARKVSRS